jgi:SAM-dependent methyltransferase
MKNLSDTQTVQADFNRIALLPEEKWNHNNHYHPFLLQQVPSPCKNALEIGCGTGRFARSLAQHADHVLAIDLAPLMIRFARERSTQYTSIDFKCVDFMQEEFPDESFDYVVSIATLHHLPLEEVLKKIKKILRVNGTLVVLDLFEHEGWADRVRSLVAIPVNMLLNIVRNGRVRPSREKRAVWDEHGKRDVYLTISRVSEVCAAVLPSARVQKHFFWRYSIVWKKFRTETRG